ncbi:hypothetical protein ACI2OW_01895 [Pseudomonas shirazica]|uniref:Uncharacterized protein n=2 Tax=Pseudomonas TaxID=286 RepID=A0A0B5KA11_PSEDL|nr:MULTISPECIES: hypothetical protein [Pseudomonas]MDY4312879.1 hypothetical protein [Pseudomonas putida]AJG12411.1 hypothetical protein RK21_00903 [Pseudomonas plecoglossicida]ESW38880.1 hypothetical protein O164_15200 [Pseudomonas taiwanensis SJ9]MBF8791041.1 hypothetical protein [Pseudomonas asiatica]MDD1984255.1 hypothetical protein [Pseudomonas asiatica]
MNALRRFALILCLVPLCSLAGVAQAAQPTSQAQAAKPVQKAAARPAHKQSAKKAGNSKARPARKQVSKEVAKPLPKAKLDLSLPADMVDNLEPNVGSLSPIQRRKPLLPPMFTEKPETSDSPFQLNGRLISNEMQLQLRNDSRREVEGAAIDFEYRQ